jgi:hypothetical protein
MANIVRRSGRRIAAGHSSALLASSLFVLAAIACPSSCRADNLVFDYLMNRGVQVGTDETVRLPAPTLPDGLNAADQRRAIESICGENHTWEDLTRKTVVAPFILKISDGQQERRGRRLDAWFVAYGDLRTLENQEFLERQMRSVTSDTDPDFGSSNKVLKAADLKRRGLALAGRPGDTEYDVVEFTLLERVRLRVTTQTTRSKTADSDLAASILDRRFMKDAEFPNLWRPIARDDEGRRRLGQPQPYFGFGGYAKVTRLIEPPGALFVEYHAAFSEPQGWFDGTNLLRSKLPILAQMIVRQLRRGFEKEASAARGQSTRSTQPPAEP